MKSFVGKFCCRYCHMHIDDIRTHNVCVEALRRNRQNYADDVIIADVSRTGVQEYSFLNEIPYFHVTESSAVCLWHDLMEGSIHPNLSNSVHHFINNKYFDLELLNKRINETDFGEAENGNKPSEVRIEHLKNKKFKMSASEMFFFIHHITFLIGDRVPVGDPVWQHVLNTMKLVDLCYLPSYNDETLRSLTDATKIYNEGLQRLFQLRLPHKCHMLTHYAKLTEDFGPLRHIQTIR